jgi:hypothetical protein
MPSCVNNHASDMLTAETAGIENSRPWIASCEELSNLTYKCLIFKEPIEKILQEYRCWLILAFLGVKKVAH